MVVSLGLSQVAEDGVADGEADDRRNEKAHVEGHHDKHQRIGEDRRVKVAAGYHEFV